MMMNTDLVLGYDFDKWNGYGIKQPIVTDISEKTNSHIILCGMSGSGKSFAINRLIATLGNFSFSNGIQGGQGKIYMADFKQDDQFSHLRACPRYYPYDKSIEALEIVYDILHKRQSGEDISRNPVTLVWDEYMANILAIQNRDKKRADEVMRKVSEILMLGRALSIRLIISLQRPDSYAFPLGSRLNYGIIIIVGAPIRSIYEMLIPKEYIDLIGERKFGAGEGIVLLQGSQLHFIKIPLVRDIERMKQVCIDALTR